MFHKKTFTSSQRFSAGCCGTLGFSKIPLRVPHHSIPLWGCKCCPSLVWHPASTPAAQWHLQLLLWELPPLVSYPVLHATLMCVAPMLGRRTWGQSGTSQPTSSPLFQPCSWGLVRRAVGVVASMWDSTEAVLAIGTGRRQTGERTGHSRVRSCPRYPHLAPARSMVLKLFSLKAPSIAFLNVDCI